MDDEALDGSDGMNHPDSGLPDYIALCSELKNPERNKTNPYFKSRYASLDAILDYLRPLLAKHNFALTQPTEWTENGLVLNTQLIHVSGWTLSGTYPVNPMKPDPQSMGSAVTYARRYSIQSLLPIAAEEDDDANAASVPEEATQPQPVKEADSDFDLKAEQARLGKAIFRMADQDEARAKEILREVTRSDKFKGFNSVRGMKQSWQFKGAWDKLGALAMEDEEPQAEDEGLF